MHVFPKASKVFDRTWEAVMGLGALVFCLPVDTTKGLHHEEKVEDLVTLFTWQKAVISISSTSDDYLLIICLSLSSTQGYLCIGMFHLYS